MIKSVVWQFYKAISTFNIMEREGGRERGRERERERERKREGEREGEREGGRERGIERERERERERGGGGEREGGRMRESLPASKCCDDALLAKSMKTLQNKEIYCCHDCKMPI